MPTRIEASWQQEFSGLVYYPISRPESQVFNEDVLNWIEPNHSLWGKYHYYLHCTDENNWDREVKELAQDHTASKLLTYLRIVQNTLFPGGQNLESCTKQF